MPIAPKKPCRKYGCGKYQEKEGYCLDHWLPRWEIQQSISDSRYHSAKWQKLRIAKLRQSPICERCGKEVANTVHHKKPIDDGGDFWDWDNLQSLSRYCHEVEHGRKKDSNNRD